MILRNTGLFVLLGILLLPAVHGQEISNRIDEYIAAFVRTGDFSGCILITKGQNSIYEECFGEANRTFGIPNSPKTRFRIGSVSKQFTAAAVLILQEKGLLRLTDTLSSYIPDRPNAHKITLEQLLTHTSGITDIYNLPGFNRFSSQDITISNLADMVLQAELTFEPGTQYQYSNGGYAVLGAVIEQAGGMPYQEFLGAYIFKPLGMDDTGHNTAGDIVPNLAVGYDPKGYSGAKITQFPDPELLKGSGSLYSTTRDLNKWVRSIEGRTLLSEVSYEKFLTDYGSNYGLGISVYRSFDQPVFGHDGRVNGYIADYLHYEESDLTIIILGNIQTGVADFFRRDIAAILFDADHTIRAKTIPPADETVTEVGELLGTYAFGPNFKVYVEYIDGSIQARANEGSYSELIPLSDGRFFSRTLYAYIEFAREGMGSVSKMLWTNNDGNTFEGVKE